MFASFFVPGWRRELGLDLLPAALGDRDRRADVVAAGHGVAHHLVAARLGQLHRDDIQFELRTKGLTWMRLPFFVWAQLVTGFLLLLAFPPLEAAGFFQLMDSVAGTSFFMPSGLVVSREIVQAAGGGSPLLWQHLFWFLAHPEVYVLILPAMGIVAEIIANNTRKPLWGYKSMVYASAFPGLHVLRRLGPPHVHDRHGPPSCSNVLPDDDDDHLDPVGDHPLVAFPVAVGRLDSFHDPDALRAGLPADVRHRGPDRAAAGFFAPPTFTCTTPTT